MGVVYVADQETPMHRRVAIKIIKPGMDTREVITRFEAERQALALMNHPHIAQVLDAGPPPAVVPISPWNWCGAFPSRSTVTNLGPAQENDCGSRGLPRHPTCPSEGNHSPRHQAVEHPCHAAQRDAHPQSDRLWSCQGPGAASDGQDGLHPSRPDDRYTVVHESRASGYRCCGYRHAQRRVLAGGTALRVADRLDTLQAQKVRAAGWQEMQRLLRETEPPRPSIRVTTQQATCTSACPRCRGEPRKLIQILRGELDWIVMKAMDKDRATLSDRPRVGADVQRYLNGEPVEACPPSVVYRFRKFAQRYKAVIATAALVAGSAHRYGNQRLAGNRSDHRAPHGRPTVGKGNRRPPGIAQTRRHVTPGTIRH